MELEKLLLSEADFIFSLLSPERIKFSRAVSDSIRLDVEVFALAAEFVEAGFGSASLLAALNLSRLVLKVELGGFLGEGFELNNVKAKWRRSSSWVRVVVVVVVVWVLSGARCG